MILWCLKVAFSLICRAKLKHRAKHWGWPSKRWRARVDGYVVEPTVSFLASGQQCTSSFCKVLLAFFFFFFLSQSVLTHAISLEYIHYAVGKREKLAHKHVGM